MKIIQNLKHLGAGVCEIQCEVCDRPFYYDKNNKHNNGMVVCPLCGLVERMKDVAGLYFVQINYQGGSGGKNWQCGSCGCEFIYHAGDSEEIIWCPNCHHHKPDEKKLDSFIENVHDAWTADSEANTKEEQK